MIVSLFNEFDMGKELCLRPPISFFNELATEKRNYARGFLLVASKRITLWKDTMSREKTRSWLPRDLHRMEDNHSGRNTCRGS